MTVEDIEHRKGLIQLYKRQLHSLEEKRARYTDLECPLHVLGQIAEVENKISELTEENVRALAREREIKLTELEINQTRMNENLRLCQMTTEELEEYLNTRRERSKLRAELEQLETELELELTRRKLEEELEMQQMKELQEAKAKMEVLIMTAKGEANAVRVKAMAEAEAAAIRARGEGEGAKEVIDRRSSGLLHLIRSLISMGIEDVITWWVLAALSVAPSEAAKSVAYLAILGMLRSDIGGQLSDIDATRFIEAIEQLIVHTEADLKIPTESTLKALKESVQKEQVLDRLGPAEPMPPAETNGEDDEEE